MPLYRIFSLCRVVTATIVYSRLGIDFVFTSFDRRRQKTLYLFRFKSLTLTEYWRFRVTQKTQPHWKSWMYFYIYSHYENRETENHRRQRRGGTRREERNEPRRHAGFQRGLHRRHQQIQKEALGQEVSVVDWPRWNTEHEQLLTGTRGWKINFSQSKCNRSWSKFRALLGGVESWADAAILEIAGCIFPTNAKRPMTL